MSAAPKMNITVNISKAHLDVVDKELARMYDLMKNTQDAGMIKWCQERIHEMQVALVTLKQSIASSILDEEDSHKDS